MFKLTSNKKPKLRTSSFWSATQVNQTISSLHPKSVIKSTYEPWTDCYDNIKPLSYLQNWPRPPTSGGNRIHGLSTKIYKVN